MQSRRAVPFFPSSTRRAKKTRGASETTRQWYASNEFKSLPKESTCSENVEFPLSRFCPQKVLDRKGTARKGVLPRKTRAHKVASQKEDAKRLFGGRGRVSNLRERASRSRKRIQGKTNSAPILFFFFEFRVWEKRFESLNVFQAFVSSSFCLSLSTILKALSLHKNCAAVKSVVVWTRRTREKMVRRCFFFARERWSKIGRTPSRGAIRVAFRWTRKDLLCRRRRQNSGFFSFFSKVVRGARCDVLDQNARTSAREMWTERASRGVKLARITRCRTRAHPMRAR